MDISSYYYILRIPSIQKCFSVQYSYESAFLIIGKQRKGYRNNQRILDSDDEFDGKNPPASTRKTRVKKGKPKPSFSSDDESDLDLFDVDSAKGEICIDLRPRWISNHLDFQVEKHFLLTHSYFSLNKFCKCCMSLSSSEGNFGQIDKL